MSIVVITISARVAGNVDSAVQPHCQPAASGAAGLACDYPQTGPLPPTPQHRLVPTIASASPTVRAVATRGRDLDRTGVLLSPVCVGAAASALPFANALATPVLQNSPYGAVIGTVPPAWDNAGAATLSRVAWRV